MNNTKWIYRSEYIPQDTSLPIDKDIINILYNRGITEEEDIEAFLHCSVEDISDPFGLADLKKSVERILEAREKGETIWIYGDYDVDGITSTSLCYLALREIGAEVRYYIPLRDEGYGLNKEALSYIKEQGGGLVITVDCGISSIGEIAHARDIGLDVIITDHHEINNILPDAYAVINPKREDNTYTFSYLAGVGTAFMLLLGVYITLEKKSDIYKYLDIVAIGTVADIVPLMEENRIFTKAGLALLPKTPHVGLRTLLKSLYPDTPDKEYNTYDVGFIIAPVFNAAGRLEDAKKGVELMTTDSQKEALEASAKLISQNNERKEIQQSILEKVEATIEKNDLASKNVIVVAGEDFHHGVIGIVASKIVDKYYKPTIVMEIKKEEGIAVASCRSIENYNLIEGLNTMSEIFTKYGGHAGAAGFSIPIENISLFSERINEHAGRYLNAADFQKPVKIDKEISLHKVSYEFLEKLSLLEPFGFGNPTPIFSMKNCLYKDLRLIGKDKNHMMLTLLKDGNEVRNCVWFGSGHNFEELVNMREIDIAFKLKREIYKDRYMNKIYLEDLNPCGSERNYLKEDSDLYDTHFPMEAVIYTRREPSDAPLYINYADGVDIIQERRVLGYLDPATASLLKKLNYSYKFNFSAKIHKVVQKAENYNIHIHISRCHNFETLAFKKGEIFRDIKAFLIGDLPYNSMQKKVLSSYFKEEKNTLIVTDPGRGSGVVIKNIALYNRALDKKTLIVTTEKLSYVYREYADISTEYLPGYHSYIYINAIPHENHPAGSVLVVSLQELDLPGYTTIVDHFMIPDNIIIKREDELISDYDSHMTYYTKKLPYESRLEFQRNIKKYHKIMATRDVAVFL